MNAMTGAQVWRKRRDSIHTLLRQYRAQLRDGLRRRNAGQVDDACTLIRATLLYCRELSRYEREAALLGLAAPPYNPYVDGPAALIGGCGPEDAAEEADSGSGWLEDVAEDDRIGHPTCPPVPAALVA